MPELPVKTESDNDRFYAAEAVIRKYIALSTVAGLIPIVFLDMAAIGALQLKMVRDLARIYRVPFRADLGKAAIAVLIGSGVSMGAGMGVSSLVNGAVRGVPVAGTLLSIATVSAFAGCATYAIGVVFNEHFASGGTFLTFDPKKDVDRFKDRYAEGAAKSWAYVKGGAG